MKNRRSHKKYYQHGGESEFLYGPDMFVYYSNLLDRKILLLGEYHVNGDCEQGGIVHHVGDWLYELIESAHECIDMFVEDRYIMKSQQTYNNGNIMHSPLEQVRNIFESCHSIDKLTCYEKFNHLRYHYIDIRRLPNDLWHQSLVIYQFLGDEPIQEFSDFREPIYDYLLTLNMTKANRLKYDEFLQLCFSRILEHNEQSKNEITKLYEQTPEYLELYFQTNTKT